MIIVPTVLAIVFGVQKNQRDKQVEQLEAENASMSVLVEQFTGSKELTAEQQERILAAIADIKAGEAHV